MQRSPRPCPTHPPLQHHRVDAGFFRNLLDRYSGPAVHRNMYRLGFRTDTLSPAATSGDELVGCEQTNGPLHLGLLAAI